MRTTFDQRVEKIGLTGAKWRVIAVVASNPGSTQRSIAATLDVTEVTAGRLIDRLCEAGHLERRPNPEDRRAYRIYVTKAAHGVLRQLKQIATVCENEAFASLRSEDVQKLEAILDKISLNLTKARDGKEPRATRTASK